MQGELKFVVTTEGFDKVKAGLADVQKGLAQTAVQTQKVDSSLGKFKGTSERAGQTLQDFGRVAQDAAFGPAAIANNITPLFESFSRLKKEAGGTIPALKTLAGTLVGPGGFLFGLSAVSAALSIAQFGLGAWTRLFSQNTKAIKENNEALKDAISKIGEERASVGILIEKLKSETLTRNQRIAAIQQLQKIAPAYFGTLNEEKATIEQITKAYENYNFAILRRIRFEAAKEKLIEVEKRILELQTKGSIINDESVQANGKILKSQRIIVAELGEELTLREQFQAFQRGTILLTKAENQELNNLIKTEQRLLSLVASQKGNEELIPDLQKSKKPREEVDKLTKKIKEVEILFDKFKQKFPGGLPSLFGVGDSAPQSIQLPKVLIDFADELNQFFTETAISIASNFGETLGNAITGQAGLADFFKGIYQIIGEGMVQLGKKLLSYVILLEKIRTFTIKNPALAIAGAISLIALGTALKNLSNVNAFATGVRNFTGGTALVGERGPELVTLPRGSNVLPAAQTASFMGGGSGLIAETRISGADLLLTLKRAGGQYNRTT